MTQHRLLGGVVAASFLTLAASALADPQLVQRPENTSNANAFAGNENSLDSAIASIERMAGGRVIEIRYQNLGGNGVYTAVVAKNGEVSNSRVDAQNGRVIAMNQAETPDWMLNWHSKRDLKSLDKTKISLSEAIMTAERAAHAPAIDAGLAKPLSPDNDVLAYNVEVVKDGKPERVTIDALNDAPIRAPGPFEAWSPEG